MQRELLDEKMTVTPVNSYYYLNQILDDRYYLTKLRKEMWPAEMTDDVMITQSKDDKPYKLIIYEKGYVLGWIMFITSMIIAFAFIWGVVLVIRFLNNLMFNKGSYLHISIKRSLLYAIMIPSSFIGYVLISNIYPIRIFGSYMFSWIGDFFGFLSHLFNFLRIPNVLSALLVYSFIIIFIFLVVHVIVSLIVKLFYRANRKK
jgi:hypothetical protein